MIIVGIDPGTETMGYGVIEAGPRQTFQNITHGVFKTSKIDSAGDRLLQLEQGLLSLLQEYKPVAMGVERLFFLNNQKTAMAVSESRGIVLLAAARQNIPAYEFTPLQMKMAIAGYGKAEKKQVQRMVQQLLSLEKLPSPDDAADGLGLAVTCAIAIQNPSFQASLQE